MAPLAFDGVHAGGGLPAATPIVPLGVFETTRKHAFAHPVKKNDKQARRPVALQGIRSGVNLSMRVLNKKGCAFGQA
jgi:hypothetical protein